MVVWWYGGMVVWWYGGMVGSETGWWAVGVKGRKVDIAQFCAGNFDIIFGLFLDCFLSHLFIQPYYRAPSARSRIAQIHYPRRVRTLHIRGCHTGSPL